MPNPMAILQSGVGVPSATAAQNSIAVFVTVLLVLVTAVLWYRSKVFGLPGENKRTREDAHAQRRDQDAAELKLRANEVGDVDLHARVDELFDVAAESTKTRLSGSVRRIYGAISLAWADRVDWMPALARRALFLAVSVVVFGAVAVSAGAVVNLLQTNPSAPSTGAVFEALGNAGESGIELVGTFPYAGQLWQLAYASAILGLQWLYGQWALIAGALFVAAVSVILLDRHLDDEVVPERLIQSRRLAAGSVLGSMVAIWATGTAVVAVGSHLGTPLLFGLAVPPLVLALACVGVAMVVSSTRWRHWTQFQGVVFVVAALSGEAWASVLGLILAGEVTGILLAKIGPIAVARIRRGIRDVAGAKARPAAAVLLIQRWLVGVSIVAGAMVAVWAVAGVSGGQWARVVSAALSAPPETQALLGAALAGIVGLFAFGVADSWPDIRDELRATIAQQRIRVQLLRRGIPWFAVFFAYVFVVMFTDRILLSLGLAVVVGLVLRKAIEVVDEATYRADTKAILKRLVRPEPGYITVLAYTLDLDGRETYLLEVNNEEFLSDDRGVVVNDGVAHARALTSNERPPAADSRQFAEFVFEHGVEPTDWEEKLDEQIRKAALGALRGSDLPIIGSLSSSRRIRRQEFDDALSDFEDGRVQRRLRRPDLHRNLELGDQYVTLLRDPFTVRDTGPEWPSLSD